MTLKDECIDAYWEQYPEESCVRGEPGDELIVSVNETDYIQPNNETNEMFMNRLERSKERGKNLFAEEWERFEYDPGCDY